MFISCNVHMAADFSTTATTVDTDVTDRFDFRYRTKR